MRGLLPICMYCKKVRDELEVWQDVEELVASQGDAQLSHGVCPGCWDAVVRPILTDLRARTPAALAGDPPGRAS